MTKSTTRTTKTSAVFLAAVLVAGTFALLSPSFMGGAEAYPDYGMDSKKYKSTYPSYGYHDDYKSKYPDKDKDKKVIVKKVKCNNINVNINGLEVGDITRTTADTLAAQAAADEQEAATTEAFGNNDNGPDFNIEDNFVFVCINNNNNAGAGAGDDDDDDDVRTCEECFDELSDTAFTALQAALSSATGFVVDFSTTNSPGPFFSLQEICEFLEEQVGEGIELNGMLQDIVEAIEALPGAGDVTDAQFEALEDCIEEALGIDNGPTV